MLTVGKFSAVSAGKRKACIEYRVLTKGTSHTSSDLLVENVHRTVAASASWPLNVVRRLDRAMVLAVANESGGAGTKGLVHSDVELVIGQDIRRQRDIVVRECATGKVGLR